MFHMSEIKRVRKRGFTIIELLTVIAIMAVLMALVFPVASTMKERGNQTACIGNLQSIGQALKLYRLDERSYPLALYGYVMDRDGNGLPDDEPTTFLYPHYMRARRDFKCPNNPNRDNESLFSDWYQGAQPGRSAPLTRVPGKEGNYSLQPVADQKIFYYVFDSYDGAVLPPVRVTQNPVPLVLAQPPSFEAPMYEQHYRHDWASLFGVAQSNPLHPMSTRELLNRNPEDSTYVTTCTYHRKYRTGENGIVLPPGEYSTDIVLFLDGHAEKFPSAEVAQKGMGVLPNQ